MNGKFKAKGFDKEEINRFAHELKTAGIPLEVVWRKGTKQVEEDHPKVNFCALQVNGKWFFQRSAKGGTVKLKDLPEQQQLILLNHLKKYGYYSKPMWLMGLVLLGIYVLIEYLVVVANISDPFWRKTLLLCVWFVLQFMGIFWLYANGKVKKSIFIFSAILGGIGYLATAIGSLLAIPLTNCFMKYYLYEQVQIRATSTEMSL